MSDAFFDWLETVTPDGPPSAPPEHLVNDGRVRVGRFSSSVPSLDLKKANVFRFGPSFLGLRAPPLEWIGFGVAHPEVYLAVILIRAYVAGASGLYVYDRGSNELFQADRAALRHRVVLAPSLNQGVSSLHLRGCDIEFRHNLLRRTHGIDFSIKGTRRRPALKAALELSWEEAHHQPLVVCAPLEAKRFIYTHKALLSVAGWLRIGDRQIDYNPARDIANLDEFHAHISLSNSWHWATLGWKESDGTVIGANLLEGWSGKRREGAPPLPGAVNGQRYHESCLLVGPDCEPLGPIAFRSHDSNGKGPWTLLEERGRIELSFTPEGVKSVHLGPLFRYQQLCGVFEGTIVTASGRRLPVASRYGVLEQGRILRGRVGVDL